ncbi:MAG: hypothetical protein HWE08_06325 [Alphaproteobacteria bacterium]|nr:hypothetical protein [Alphaproteobacteria bacterium]
MRFAALLLALGLVMGAPIAPTGLMNKAEAQAATMTMEEQQLQAQLVALAQAGDTDGIKTLIRTKIAQGKASMVAKVAKAVANMGASLAVSDATSAAALVNAAVLIANDPSVSAADSTVSSQVATAAGLAMARMWDASGATVTFANGQQEVRSNNPTMLAAVNSIVAAVNASSNSSFRNTVYTNAPPGGMKALDSNRPQNNQQASGGGTGGVGGGQLTGTTRTTTRRTVQTPVVTPTTTDTVTVPVVPEPNPGQSSGSPT